MPLNERNNRKKRSGQKARRGGPEPGLRGRRSEERRESQPRGRQDRSAQSIEADEDMSLDQE